MNIMNLELYFSLWKFIEILIQNIRRIPSDDQRARWIDAITKHQNYDESRTVIYVCMRHFDPSHIVIRGNQKILKMDVIPTIFDATNCKNNASLQVNTNDERNINNSQNECANVIALQARVKELEKEILNLKVQHNMEMQKIQISSKKKIQKQTEKFKDAKKEATKQKTKVLRLEDVIQELHENQYISPDDVKFLNVRSKIPFY